MIEGIGVDIVEISRFKNIVEKRGSRFTDKFLPIANWNCAAKRSTAFNRLRSDGR